MKFIFLGGIILFIGSILLIVSNYDDLNIERKGTIVKMRIEQLPKSCMGTKFKHFMTLSYMGDKFIKRIGAGFCDDHKVGELINMKFLEGSSEVLFPDESVFTNFLASGLLGLLGIGIFLSQIKKIRK